jgi:hypothetical protein
MARSALLLLALAQAGSPALLGCKSMDDLEKSLRAEGTPLIAAVVPAEGRAGTGVAVRGSNFGGSPGEIGFQDPATGRLVPSKVVAWSSDLIVTVVPAIPGPVGSTQVGLRTADGKVPPFFGQFKLVE